jgi:hypothetical protein
MNLFSRGLFDSQVLAFEWNFLVAFMIHVMEIDEWLTRSTFSGINSLHPQQRPCRALG